MKFVLAFILLCLTAGQGWTACTTLPFTLLPGVPPDGAKMMADLQALNDNCSPLTANAPGVLTLIFPIGTTGGTVPGTVITPDGSAVPNIGATVTGGFNEAEAYAFVRGWSTWVIGTGEFQAEGSLPLASYVQTTDPGGFVLKPLANRSVRLTGIQILCGGAANNGCLNVDSMMKGKIICEGCEIGSQPTTPSASTTCAWNINPHTAVPNENRIGITDSYIELGNVSANSPGTALGAVCVDLSSAGVNQSTFQANEINTGGAGGTPLANYDFIVQGTDGTTSFAGNLLHFGHVHLAKIAGIQIGANTTNQQLYAGNIYKIGTLFPGFSGTQAINTYGQNDQFEVGLITNAETLAGSYQTPAFFHTGALQNTLNVGQQSGASNGNGCASVIDQTNSSISPAYQNNYTLNGQACNLLTPSGQINELAPTGLVSGAGAACMAGFVCTNHRGTVDVGTGNPTTVQISFSMTYLNPPKCTVTAGANGLTFFRQAYTTGGGGYTAVQYATNGAATMAQHTPVDYECQ